jgi:integrase
MSLTKKRIEKLITPGRFGDGRGLYLQVISPTNRSWLLRYEHGKKIASSHIKRKGKLVPNPRAGQMVPNERWMGLGPEAEVSLELAREEARKARLMLRQGIDPIDQRKAQEAALAIQNVRSVTFQEATQQYFDVRNVKWKNDKHRAQFLATMKAYVFPHLGSFPVSKIDKTLVLRVLEQKLKDEKGRVIGTFWQERTETAQRVRQRVEAVLNFAGVRGWREGENPARWRGHLSFALLSRTDMRKKVESHSALPYADIPAFMAELRKRESNSARALEFLILCASRTGEVIGAVWDEFDLENGLWTIPEGRMKAGREHRVPLTKDAIALLKKQQLRREKGNDFVFGGARSGYGLSNMALTQMLRGMGQGGVTTHGFRSTFKDWVFDETNFPRELAEMSLAHKVGDDTELAYWRSDGLKKRASLMEAWASYCNGSAGDNVETIRRAG